MASLRTSIRPIIVGIALIAGPLHAGSATANYPKESLKAGEQGRVGFTVEVTEAGRGTNCKVTESSGYPRLDKATCEQVEAYGRFRPAEDANGKPIRGSYSGHVNWVID